MKYYYGLINGNYGFTDIETQGFIELTQEEHQQLLDEQSQGREIVSYEGRVFTANPGLYYVDESKIWHKKDEEEYERELLEKAKERKKEEATSKAYEYINDGNALYEFEEGIHIEATDGNIAKLTAYILSYVSGQRGEEDTVIWNTKEDETILLNKAQIIEILNGIGNEQARVWNNKFPYYLELIKSAQSVEEVNEIIIDYGEESEK